MSSRRKRIVASSPLVEITLLHRAMRFELEGMCELARRLVGVDSTREGVLALQTRLVDFDSVFSSHSSAEDDFIFPALAKRGCALASEAASEHLEEARLMGAVEEAIRSAAAGGADGVSTHTAQLFLQLKERLSEHMLREEEQIFPALARFSDAELGRLVGLVLGSRPAEVLGKTIKLQVAHLEAEHARHVLSTMCDVAKKTQFRAWLQHELGTMQGRHPSSGALPPPPPPPNPNHTLHHHQGGPHHVGTVTPPPTPPTPPPCPYYGITTRVRAPCCGATVCCRRCHDESPETCGRPMDQSRVEAMLCGACGEWSPVGPHCGYCGTKSAAYHCGVCKLLDSSLAPTYHCPFCNVCRRGHGLGIDFHHCMACNMCVNLSQLENHYCSGAANVGATTPTCGLCTKSLFGSSDHVDVLPCGHPAHRGCAAAAVEAIPPPSCALCAASGLVKHSAPWRNNPVR